MGKGSVWGLWLTFSAHIRTWAEECFAVPLSLTPGKSFVFFFFFISPWFWGSSVFDVTSSCQKHTFTWDFTRWGILQFLHLWIQKIKTRHYLICFSSIQELEQNVIDSKNSIVTELNFTSSNLSFQPICHFASK